MELYLVLMSQFCSQSTSKTLHLCFIKNDFIVKLFGLQKHASEINNALLCSIMIKQTLGINGLFSSDQLICPLTQATVASCLPGLLPTFPHSTPHNKFCLYLSLSSVLFLVYAIKNRFSPTIVRKVVLWRCRTQQCHIIIIINLTKSGNLPRILLLVVVSSVENIGARLNLC